MREKLNGLSLTFRLSAEQSALVSEAMKIEKTSNVSEFVRRLLLKGSEQIIEDDSLRGARLAAARAAIAIPADLKLRLASTEYVQSEPREMIAAEDATPPASTQKKSVSALGGKPRSVASLPISGSQKNAG